jgi:hypothetical protein
VPAYQRRYGEKAFVSAAYHKQIASLINSLCRKHGLPDRKERQKVREFIGQKVDQKAEQMQLF